MISSVFDLEVNGITMGVHYWAPDGGDVVGVLQVAHGLAEHGGRYVGLADSLTQRGWVVAAGDHRGHGLTARSEADLGFFAERDGWNRVVEDVRTLQLHLRARHPDVPMVLMGHSMGSLLARDFAARYGQHLDGLVLSGSPRPKGLIGMAGRMLAKRRQPRSRAHQLHRLSFGGYNDAFKPTRTDYDWLTRDQDIVDDYIADPRCGFVATNGLYVDLIGGLQRVNKTKVAQQTPSKLPTLVMYGAMDPVGGPRAHEALTSLFKKAGLKKAQVIAYKDSRHEVFNEVNRAQTHADLAEWLDELVDDAD